MDLNTWLIYLLAATGLSLSPGPNGLLALTHGALHGRRKALYTIFGGAFGFVAVVGLSMFGIGALLKTSLVWLTVLKWVGGAYLVWLGIQVWRSPPIGIEARGRTAGPRAGGSLFRQGALSALTNPKGLLFFTAFLPQFIDPARASSSSSSSWPGRSPSSKSPRRCSSPAWRIASAHGFSALAGGSTRPVVACSWR
jgi:threonine/homoserine/homoserine lactone efflux protein